MSSGIQNPQDSSYIDFGMSFGSNIWGFIDYPPPNYTGVLNETKMNAYLQSLFQQMEKAGQNTVDLAFAQLDNIDAYDSGNFDASGVDTSYDVIASLLSSLQKNNVSVPGYSDFLSYFVAQAHANGMKVNISFGGGVATDSTFKILEQSGETYQGEAEKLADFIKKYGIDGVDFDIEDPSALSSQGPDSSGQNVFSFFATLHSILEPEGKATTLTTMLGVSWRSTFSQMLSNFTSYFDGLNLMAYSDSQYWLDPNTPSGDPDQGWTIEEWIDAIGRQNAGMIHIGFDDGVPYANPSANGGQYKYNIQPGSSNGQAAAQIYLALLAQLKADGYPSTLGDPFFWPAADVKPNGQDRYAPTSSGGSNFVSSDMQDFYNWLLTHNQIS
jgi:hypothetical protein